MKTYSTHDLVAGFDSLKVLDAISADFPAASITVILGPSGCGKTTFLNVIAGLLAPQSGHVTLFDKASFSYCFQDPRLLPWLTARENIHFALSSIPEEERKKRAETFLGYAGLGAFADTYPAQLSGGMRKRLALARAFSYPSEVLLLDESFSSIDLKQRIELMDLFSRLWTEEKRTSILVTHEIQDALYLADRILVFSSRPARLLTALDIKTNREDRVYGSKSFVELEDTLYRLILS